MSRKQGIIYYMNHSPVPYLLCADVTWFLAHSCGGKLPTESKYWYMYNKFPAIILSMYLPCAAVHLVNSTSLYWESNHHFINAIIQLICSWKKTITTNICCPCQCSIEQPWFLHQDGSRNGKTHNWFLYPYTLVFIWSLPSHTTGT